MSFSSHKALVQQANHEEAFNYAKAERSDPFSYSRVRSHLNNGVAHLGDYSAEWHEEDRHINVGDSVESYRVKVPHSIKRV